MLLDKIQQYLPFLLEGAWLTARIAMAAIVLATIMAFIGGLSNMSRSRLVRGISRTYIEVFRGSSELVQLYWGYYALAIILGIQFEAITIGIAVLGLNLGAYGSEIVRGAVLAVPKEQYEGATALNMSSFQRMRKVIVPQAIAAMIPPFNNLYIQLLKGTSLLSLITVAGLTFNAELIIGRAAGDTLLIFMMVLVMYLIMSYVITLVMRLLEYLANVNLGKRSLSGGLLARRTVGEPA